MQTNNRLREALKALVDVIDKYDSGSTLWWHSWAKGVKPLKDARAALAEPVKNCEVGTAEEQSKRLHDYCKSHRCLNCSSGNGDECKFYRPGMKTDCKLAWAQMPYEEGGAK